MLPSHTPGRFLAVIAAVVLLRVSAGANLVTLDDNSNYNVSWSYTDLTITFTLTVRTSGWIGFGLSPNGGMRNSDMVIVGVKNGADAISDSHTLTELRPIEDTEQDWTLHSRSVAAGVTTITVSRPLKICRSNNEDATINSDTLRLIYAYGPEEWASYHQTRRGTKSLYLLTKDTSSLQEEPVDAQTIDLVVSDLVIPSDSTTYWCTLFKLPTFGGKRHVISYEPIVAEGNEKFVHHILIYGCFHNVTGDEYIDNNQHSNACRGKNMPDDLKACQSSLFAWAIGGGKFSYPAEAGYPLGTDSTPEYVLMEMHYDNPKMEAGRKDSSGIRLTYSTELRPNDVGVLSVGNVDNILVPPQRPVTDVTFMCSSSCTEESVPEEGITIFAGLLHSHLLGRKITIRHTKANTSSSILMKDHSYDFNFQELRHLRQGVKLHKGDSLQITCSMDSSSRDTATYGGDSTSEEMCWSFLSYYPKISLSACLSLPPLIRGAFIPELYEQLGITHIQNTEFYKQGFVPLTAFKNVSWTKEKGDLVQASYYDDFHISLCINDTTEPTKGSFEQIPGSDFVKKEESAGECDYTSAASVAQHRASLLLTIAAIWCVNKIW